MLKTDGLFPQDTSLILKPALLSENLKRQPYLALRELPLVIAPRIRAGNNFFLCEGRIPRGDPMYRCQQFQAERRLEPFDKLRHPVEA